MRAVLVLFVGIVCAAVLGAPVQPSSEQPAANTLGSMDLGLTVFDQNAAKSADQNKNYVVLAFDDSSCNGENAEKCKDLEAALAQVVSAKDADPIAKYRSTVVFGKANKDSFPDHKQDFEKAKIPLPAVLFWPAGHSRPSCKFDAPHATGDQVGKWLQAKLKEEEEDDDLLQLEEGESDKVDEVALLVCQADGGPNVVPKEAPTCGDVMEGMDLLQTEKTQKIWDFKNAEQKQIGPADNSLPHVVSGGEGHVRELDAAAYKDLSKQGKWVALYFHASWCHYCECLEPVWKGVSSNLVDSQRQPDLVVTSVDGDTNPELRDIFNVTAYPTFLLVNKEGNKVLGRYLGPRKVFELSNWIEDLIVAEENPIVKHEFEPSQQGEHTDMHPVFPYTGPRAFGEESMAAQSLAAVSAQATLGGNDFDECMESDEAKFTAPGAALLVHYGSDSSSSLRALEMDGEVINLDKVPEKPMVIDFYAPWCPHCQKLNPVWDAVSAKFTDGSVTVGKVDMETHVNVKKQFGIRRFPTIMYFPPGQKMSFDEARRYTGQRDVEHLQQWINSMKPQGAH